MGLNLERQSPPNCGADQKARLYSVPCRSSGFSEHGDPFFEQHAVVVGLFHFG